MTRMPGGHPDSSGTPVASATQADPGHDRGHRSDSSARPDRTNPVVEAFTFELGKVNEQGIKERELQVLANVDTDLCEQVAPR